MDVWTRHWAIILKECTRSSAGIPAYKITDIDVFFYIAYLSHSSELQLAVDSGEVSLHISARLAKVLVIP